MRDPINPPIISPDHFVWDLALSVSDEIINDSGREFYVELRSIGPFCQNQLLCQIRDNLKTRF